MSSLLSDIELMQMALLEAIKVRNYDVFPNPRVGAVLQSSQGEIVSAFHSKAGELHAEAKVLELCRQRKINPKGATIAVTLEPCSHFGKTPPCADALIAAGVGRVIFGLKDPHAKVSGQGAEKLKNAKIDILEGVLGQECFELNRAWLTSHRRGWPFVRLKMATSLDGLWGSQSGESQWITGPVARLHAMELRATSQLIITGSGTIVKDNPQMTVRDVATFAQLPQPKVWILSQDEKFSVDEFRIKNHPGFAGVQSEKSLPALLKRAYQQNFSELLIEAGPKLTFSFLQEGLFDEIHLFVASKFLGGQGLRLGAFNEGKLPGLEVRIRSSRNLDPYNQYMILEKI